MLAVAYTMVILYTVGLIYLILFTVGYAMRAKHRVAMSGVHGLVSVIVPVYNEKTKILSECMESLASQSVRRKIKLYVVLTAPHRGQAQLVERYRSTFSSVTVVHQRRPSLVKAYLAALSHISTEFTCIVNADILLEPEAIGRLYGFAKQNKLDIGFGLIMPTSTSRFSKFTSIKKLVRQLLLQSGRGALGMGYYIPGAFYIANSVVLKDNLRETFTDDAALMLESYSKKLFNVKLLPEVLAHELEKRTFYSWTMQFSRWFIGNAKIYPLWIDAFAKSETKVRFGIFGLLYIWYVLPLSMTIGMVAVLLGTLNVWLFFAFYAVLTITLYGMKQVRKYGKLYVASFWVVYSLAKTCGILISPYILEVIKRDVSKSRIIFKR
ncbi:MAG: glycosyltransferase family 2 protein [Candidatus Bathyarchaeia archaeon]